MTCFEDSERCPNKARYIDEDGRFACGICDAVFGGDAASIRMSDVPQLIKLLHDIADRRRNPGMSNALDVSALEHADVNDMLELISKRGITF